MDNRIEEKISTIAGQTGISLTGGVVESGLKYAYNVIIARNIGAELLGIYFLGLTVINFAGVFSRLGLDNGVLHFVALYKGTDDSQRVKGIIFLALKITLMASISLSGFLFLYADRISLNIFNEPCLTSTIRFFLLSLPFSGLLAVLLSYFQAFHRLKYRIFVQGIFQPTLNILIVLVLFFLGLKLLGAIFSYVISIILSLGLAVYYMRSKFTIFDNDKEITPIFEGRRLLKFSLPLLFVSFLSLVIQWTDTLMLGYFREPQEVGIYNMALRTAMLCALILISFNSVFAPMISDLYHRREIGQLETLFKVGTKWIFSLTFPIFLLFMFFARDVLNIFGSEFVSGAPSFILLSFAQLVNAAVGSVGYMIMMSGRPNISLINVAALCLMNVTLNFLLIPIYGIWGAAIATATSLILINLIGLIEVYYLLKIHPYSRGYIKPLIAGVISAFTFCTFKSWVIGIFTVGWLISSALIFLCVYTSVLYLLRFDREDRLIFDILRKRFVVI